MYKIKGDHSALLCILFQVVSQAIQFLSNLTHFYLLISFFYDKNFFKNLKIITNYIKLDITFKRDTYF